MVSQMAMLCHYDVMGLQPNCSADEIRSAFKKLALRRHPDKAVNSGLTQAEATVRFQNLNRAYEILSNPTARIQYDLQYESRCRRKRKRTEEKPTSDERELARELEKERERERKRRQERQREYMSEYVYEGNSEMPWRKFEEKDREERKKKIKEMMQKERERRFYEEVDRLVAESASRKAAPESFFCFSCDLKFNSKADWVNHCSSCTNMRKGLGGTYKKYSMKAGYFR